jgi:hypothetical protein
VDELARCTTCSKNLGHQGPSVLKERVQQNLAKCHLGGTLTSLTGTLYPIVMYKVEKSIDNNDFFSGCGMRSISDTV